jgi:hypothetical protein
MVIGHHAGVPLAVEVGEIVANGLGIRGQLVLRQDRADGETGW